MRGPLSIIADLSEIDSIAGLPDEEVCRIILDEFAREGLEKLGQKLSPGSNVKWFRRAVAVRRKVA